MQRMRAWILLFVLIGIAFLIGIATSGDESAVVSLADLRDEEVVFLDEHRIYLVYNDGDPLALSADAQHVGDEVRFCPSSRMFESAAHGEKFDIRGFYYGGPAQRGLDRYPVRIEGDGVFVDVEHPMQGADRGEGPALDPEGRFCFEDGESPPTD